MINKNEIRQLTVQNINDVMKLLPKKYPFIKIKKVKISLSKGDDNHVFLYELKSNYPTSKSVKKQITNFLNSELQHRHSISNSTVSIMVFVIVNHNNHKKMIIADYC